VGQPHFGNEALTRARAATQAALNRAAQDPEQLAAQNLYQLMFREHRYGLPTQGLAQNVAAFTRSQIQARHKKVMRRDNLVLAVVGNINADTLRAVMNSVFNDLVGARGEAVGVVPDVAPNVAPNVVVPLEAEGIHITRKGPQTTLFFGQKGVARNDADFFAYYLANHILGGGGFTSRLVEKVRNEKGLAYGVYSALAPYKDRSLWFGYVASRNETVGNAMHLIRQEMTAMAAGAISRAELANAKAYLTGAYALRFDSGAKIVRELLRTQLDEQGIDYFTTRNSRINAVSLGEVKAAAALLFKPDELFVSSVGQFLNQEGQ
ncbi:MAG: insulinase family protein, partial [Alphaproteobacteria bacterium]|nr:insulinase family protein [Alphaproteobacteria bacterium]